MPLAYTFSSLSCHVSAIKASDTLALVFLEVLCSQSSADLLENSEFSTPKNR